MIVLNMLDVLSGFDEMHSMSTQCERLIIALFAVAVSGCASQPQPKIQQVDQARAAYEARRYDRCEKILTAYLRQNAMKPEAAEAYYVRGLSRIRSGNRSKAKRDIETGHRIARDNELKAMLAVQLGNFDFDDERYGRARDHYEGAVKHLPDGSPSDKALYRLAVSQFRVGQFREGRKSLAELIRRFPKSTLAPAANRIKNWDGEYFTIQCGAFNSQPRAQQAARSLRRSGFNAITVRDTNSTIRHVVRVGKFRTYGEARKALDKVRRHQSDAFILP